MLLRVSGLGLGFLGACRLWGKGVWGGFVGFEGFRGFRGLGCGSGSKVLRCRGQGLKLKSWTQGSKLGSKHVQGGSRVLDFGFSWGLGFRVSGFGFR